MARRTHYRNGDEITLHCGCNDCSPNMINGVLCHEPSCPSAWKDEKVECSECGSVFFSKFATICEDCSTSLAETQDLDDEMEGESDDDDEGYDDTMDDDEED